MVNWQEIHKDFTEELQNKWEDNGFNYEECKKWIDIGLGVDDSNFAWWLAKKNSPENLNHNEIRELKGELEQKWKNIHEGFKSLEEITSWIKRGFDTQVTKEWIEAGLTPYEYDFASRLKEGGYSPKYVSKNFQSSQSDVAQEWVDYFYPKGTKDDIKELEIISRSLEGSLKLEGFVALEELQCNHNELTNLDVSQCPNLRKICCQNNCLISLNVKNLVNLQELFCEENQLINLDCSNCSQLEKLDCSGNKISNLKLTNCFDIIELNCRVNSLTNLDFLNDLPSEKLEGLNIRGNNLSAGNLSFFSRFINLKELELGVLYCVNDEEDAYNRFYGSLEPLKKLANLRRLDIRGTDVDSGLEYLPDSIEELCCSSGERPGSKVLLIEQELRKFGIPGGDILNVAEEDIFCDDFILLLRSWRKTNPKKIKNARPIKWMEELEEKLKEKDEQIANLQKEKKELEKRLGELEKSSQEKTKLSKTIEECGYHSGPTETDENNQQQTQIEIPPK